MALWREGLLALKVLSGATRGYRHHPQLTRFRTCPDPAAAMVAYLHGVYAEAEARGYSFERAKLPPRQAVAPIEETEGQLRFEWEHLLNKLQARSPAYYAALRDVATPEAHPLFSIIPGAVRDWEKGPP